MDRVDVHKSIYPAMLSQLAKAFKNRIQFGTHLKDMLEYHECFQGKQGVDLLSKLIGTKDRNIAILLGRTLSSQGFFHDVTWTHSLRDSLHEYYKFIDEDSTPIGVFTLLTQCYSPTCSTKQLCYSISCPRRFEQQNQLVGLPITPTPVKPAELWSVSVPQEVLESVSKMEQTRQEVIYEIIQTEKDFVNDLKNTIQYYMEPLKEREIFALDKREEYVKVMFSNIQELYNINAKLLKKLISRQKEAYVVDRIGDIIANVTNELYPYIEYGAQQILGKTLLDEERINNPEFAKFLKETEKLPEFRKLPIDSFLACPTTRMGRYPLLLETVMKKSNDIHPDRELIPQALADFRNILKNINSEAGKSKNIVQLRKLHKLIIGAEEDTMVLKLQEEGRHVIRDGNVIMRKNQDLEIHLFLFDHLLLVTKKRENFYKILKRPIPLELLTIQETKDLQDNQDGKTFLISFSVPSRFGGNFQLQTPTEADRNTWKTSIEKQKLKLDEKKRKFEIYPLVTKNFPLKNPINCCCTYQNQMIIGTNHGLFINCLVKNSMLDLSSPKFMKVLELERICQVDVIPKIDMLMVLADKILLAYPLRAVLQILGDPSTEEKLRPKKIGSTINFFRQGICSNMTLVCTVKSTTLMATVKVLEPVGLGVSRLNGKIGQMFKAKNESLRLKKELYIPSETKSLHFLNTKLCLGCTKGFEIVDFETLNTHSLLDVGDEHLDFVLRKDSTRPVTIFNMKDDFGFFIDNQGKRYRPEFLINWAGIPIHFMFIHPYIIAYESNFIEIYNIECGDLQQVINTKNLRALSEDPLSMDCVMDDEEGDSQIVFKLQLKNEFLQ